MKTFTTLVFFSLFCLKAYSQNVGINTKTPTANFHVKGTFRLEDLSNVDSLARILGIDTSGNIYWKNASFWGLKGNSGTNALTNFLGTTDNQRLVFKTNNSEKFTLLANGYAGLNISNPDRLFVLQNPFVGNNAELVLRQKAGSSLGSFITFDNAANTLGQRWSIGTTGPTNYTTLTGTLEFYQFGHGTRMILDSTGKLGINLGAVNPPTAILHTRGTVRFEGLTSNSNVTKVLLTDDNGNVFWRTSSSISGLNNWSLSGNTGTNASTNFLGTSDNNSLTFKTNNISRMNLLADGGLRLRTIDNSNLLIRNSPNASGENDNIGIDFIRNDAPDNAATNIKARIEFDGYPLTYPDASVLHSGYLRFFTNNNISLIQRLVITPSGNVGIGSEYNYPVSGGNEVTRPFEVSCGNQPVRFKNLPPGSGNVLVIDANGDIRISNTQARVIKSSDNEVTALQNQIDVLKNELNELKTQISAMKKK